MTWRSDDDLAQIAATGRLNNGELPKPVEQSPDEQSRQRMYAHTMKLTDEIRQAFYYRTDWFTKTTTPPRYDGAARLAAKMKRLAEYCDEAQRGEITWRSAEAMYEDVSGDQLAPAGTPVAPISAPKKVETLPAVSDRIIPLGKIA